MSSYFEFNVSTILLLFIGNYVSTINKINGILDFNSLV